MGFSECSKIKSFLEEAGVGQLPKKQLSLPEIFDKYKTELIDTDLKLQIHLGFAFLIIVNYICSVHYICLS